MTSNGLLFCKSSASWILALADLKPVAVFQREQRVHQPCIGVNVRYIQCLGRNVKHLCQRSGYILCDEIQDYFKQLYGLEPDSRIFPLSKYALKRGMAFGCKASGVKVIRIHDLRHSHVSLLINMGYSAVAIGNRVGHESVEITYRYAHLFPTVRKEMADMDTVGDIVEYVKNEMD